jgi:type I restriction enzyme S subunit
MKPSGINWLGDIPEDWDVKKLKHLGKFIAGYAFKSEDFIDSGTRVIKITNIETMKLNWEDESFLPIEYLREYESFSAGNGDFVFALTRPIISSGLKAALIEDCSQRVLVNQRNAIFHPNLLVNKRFIYFTAFSAQFLASFSSKLDATGQQPNISTSEIGNISIPLPPLSEQKAIAEYLDRETGKIDSLISRVESAIGKLKEYRSAVISAAVTGKIATTEHTEYTEG